MKPLPYIMYTFNCLREGSRQRFLKLVNNLQIQWFVRIVVLLDRIQFKTIILWDLKEQEK